MEALGQHVDEEAADEFAGVERHGHVAAGALDPVVLDLERDAVLVDCEVSGFCSTCGTKLFLDLERFPGTLGVYGGTFDDPNWFERTPQVSRHIFLDSAIERDDFSSNRHPALSFCLSMIFSENWYPLFRIML